MGLTCISHPTHTCLSTWLAPELFRRSSLGHGEEVRVRESQKHRGRHRCLPIAVAKLADMTACLTADRQVLGRSSTRWSGSRTRGYGRRRGSNELADDAGPGAVADDGPQTDGTTQVDLATRTRPVGHVIAFTGASDLLRTASDEDAWQWHRQFAFARQQHDVLYHNTQKDSEKRRKNIVTITHPQQPATKLQIQLFRDFIQSELIKSIGAKGTLYKRVHLRAARLRSFCVPVALKVRPR